MADQKPIGSTFYNELVAAGVYDWRFSWDGPTGTISFSPDMENDDPAQVELVQQVYAAHDPMRGARSDKIAQLTAYAQGAVYGGAQSDALGATHTYPTDPQHQVDMLGSVVDALLDHPADWTTPFQCTDADGVTALREHTAAQIKQAGSDIKAASVAVQRRLAQLIADVNNTTTQDEINAITWTMT
jgi:hypothetical protein